MINAMQIAIIKKDLRGVILNKRLLPSLLMVPLVFTVFIPTLFILLIHFAPEDMSDFQELLNLLPLNQQVGDTQHLLTSLVLNHIIPIFFMIIPLMTATIMAASSFAGEKERRTLETLFYCPLTLKQIFHSKILASFIFSMLVSGGSFLVMLLVVQVEILLLSGSLMPLSPNWLIAMLLVAPATALMAITLIVRGSAKAQTMDEAQQQAIFMILPLLLLLVGQFMGVILVNAWMLFGLGVVLALIAGLLMQRGMRNLDYERIILL